MPFRSFGYPDEGAPSPLIAGFIPCLRCRGTGREPCYACDGTGQAGGNTCFNCNGRGAFRCESCQGAGGDYASGASS